MEAEDFPWILSTGFGYPEDMRFTRGLYRNISKELKGRAPLVKDKKKENRLYIVFGARGETAYEAVREGLAAIEASIGSLGIRWLQLEKVTIVPSDIIDQDRARIDSATGRMRPEADILEFKPKEDS